MPDNDGSLKRMLTTKYTVIIASTIKTKERLSNMKIE
jgi:hypothetical protein